MFYAKLLLIFLWMIITCFFGILVTFVRWKDPSVGHLFAKWFAWGALKICRIKIQVEGEEHLYAHQPCVYTPNHQSSLEVATFGSIYPRNTISIGKIEVVFVPLFGFFFWSSGSILINRQKRKHAIAGLDAAVEEVKRRRVSVWIFPEGTRNPDGSALLPFKKGAFHTAIGAQIPIVPIVCEPMSPVADWDHRRIRGGALHVKILPPVSVEGMTREDVNRLSDIVREKMTAALEELKQKRAAQSS